MNKASAPLYNALLRHFQDAKTPTPNFAAIAQACGCTAALARRAWEIGFPQLGSVYSPIRSILFGMDLEAASLEIAKKLSNEDVEFTAQLQRELRAAQVQMKAKQTALLRDLSVSVGHQVQGALEVSEAGSALATKLVELIEVRVEEARAAGAGDLGPLLQLYERLQAINKDAVTSVSKLIEAYKDFKGITFDVTNTSSTMPREDAERYVEEVAGVLEAAKAAAAGVDFEAFRSASFGSSNIAASAAADNVEGED